MPRATFQITGASKAEGWLLKEGHDIFKSWYERYFVLDAAEKKITYYTDASKKDIKGEYKFTPGSTVDASTANASQQHLFVLTGRSAKGEGKSELFMSATSPEIKNKWIQHIRKAIKGESFLLESMQQGATDAYKKIEHEIAVDMGYEKRADGEEPCCGCDWLRKFIAGEEDKLKERGEDRAEDWLKSICPF